uniref:RRM domain-containing protein n=1 Tax=Kalanchoe fedtschenkoi TaxID=63787 RepID=A0A7N0SXX9_KALFE
MDPTKKRKIDDNGIGIGLPPQTDASSGGEHLSRLTPDDARKIIESFSKDQLMEILQSAVLRHGDVLDSVRSIADRDTAQRKLFIRGLGWDTTTEGLRSLFSSYGELEEAIVIVDKTTGKSKGYGFVTFKHVDGALLALKEPSKKIDGRVTVTQLAAAGAAGNTGVTGQAVDVSMRKIFVGNVPFDMPADRLLNHFQGYGDVEEGPLGFDKQTGKSRGFALFVYKTPEGAQAALVEPTKVIDGRQLLCKLAIDGKRNKPPGGQGGEMGGDGQAQGVGMPGQYGGPGGYNGNSAGYQGQNSMGHHHGMNASYMPPGQGGAGPVGGYGMGSSHYGGPGAAGYGGLGGASGGTSMYGRVPPNSGAGAYPEGGGHWPSSAYPNQAHQPTGNSPAPRVPAGGMYGTMPPYY